MRENIGLFRGKRIDNGEWVEGFYHRVTNNWTHENVHYITHFQDMPITGETILTVQYDVDPDTIGECTGLKDKNGELIFEGDIVKNDYGYIGQIVFKACSYYIEWKSGNFTIDLYVMADNLEIIGTIHDNPELLKGGEGE